MTANTRAYLVTIFVPLLLGVSAAWLTSGWRSLDDDPKLLYPGTSFGPAAHVQARGFPIAVWASSEGSAYFVPPEPRTRHLWGGWVWNMLFYTALTFLPTLILMWPEVGYTRPRRQIPG